MPPQTLTLTNQPNQTPVCSDANPQGEPTKYLKLKDVTPESLPQTFTRFQKQYPGILADAICQSGTDY